MNVNITSANVIKEPIPNLGSKNSQRKLFSIAKPIFKSITPSPGRNLNILDLSQKIDLSVYGEKEENLDSSPLLCSNVLDSLRGTSKGKLIYPEPNINSNDLCDLKVIGDLSNISFSHGFSFKNISSGSDDDDSEEEKEDIVHLTSISMNDADDQEEALEKYPYIELHSTLSQLKIEYELHKQVKCLEKRDVYTSKVKDIRTSFAQQLHQNRQQLQQNLHAKLQQEQNLLAKATQEASEKVQEYELCVNKWKKNLLKEIQLVQEEEQTSHKMQQLKEKEFLEKMQKITRNYLYFTERLSKLQTQFSEFEKLLGMDPSLQIQTLQATALQTKVVIDSAQEQTQDALNDTQTILEQAIHVVDNLQNNIDVKLSQQNTTSVELTKASEIVSCGHSVDAKSTAAEASSTATAAVKGSLTEEVSAVHAAVKNAHERFEKLKSDVDALAVVAEKLREDANLRPRLSKAVGVINQLTNDKPATNKGKLQQILNLLNGRNFNIGDLTVNISGNSSATAFVKHLLSSRIVSLAHDKQVTSMAVYASLFVRLWQLHPAIGQLLLYKLYVCCPILVPLAKHSSSQRVGYELLPGQRIKDKVVEPKAKYLSRMVAAGKYYGRIISLQMTDSHPHGLQEGWKWLTRMLLSNPFPDVSAAVTSGFLTTAAHMLIKHYKKQFQKLTLLYLNQFIPKLEECGSEVGLSDLSNLKKILQDIVTKGSIPPVEEGYNPLL